MFIHISTEIFHEKHDNIISFLFTSIIQFFAFRNIRRDMIEENTLITDLRVYRYIITSRNRS